VDPSHFERRETTAVDLGGGREAGAGQPPRVIARVTAAALADPAAEFRGPRFAETPAEGLLVPVGSAEALRGLAGGLAAAARLDPSFLVLDLPGDIDPDAVDRLLPAVPAVDPRLVLLRRFAAGDGAVLAAFASLARRRGLALACDTDPDDLPGLAPSLAPLGGGRLLFTLGACPGKSAAGGPTPGHAIGAYRRLASALDRLGIRAPIWIRNTAANAVRDEPGFLSRLIEASLLTGSLLCDGRGDLVSIETEPDAARSVRLAYNVLQGAGARISKTEFVACPSCGRTLFDLQSTTQRIRSQTGHLKGLKIAIMGCIVNGPGEMADADFGYVGGAPGKINLYVGRSCVQYNVPQAEADARLIALIRERGKWAEPPVAGA
jgi:(E)-4-hydroxy-3-methylbut-2-enyl-diphosphate synthase